MKLEILQDGNPILRKKSEQITEITEQINQLIFDMAETMKEEKGIGLAAPQVGKNIRLIIVDTKNGPLALLNPKIISRSFFKDVEEEGCLSVKNVWGKVKRSKSIKVKALNKRGKEVSFKAQGLFARVIQHEVDHLEGVLFIDKLVKINK